MPSPSQRPGFGRTTPPSGISDAREGRPGWERPPGVMRAAGLLTWKCPRAPQRRAGMVLWSAGAPQHGHGRQFAGVVAHHEGPVAPRRTVGTIPVPVVEQTRSTTGAEPGNPGSSGAPYRPRTPKIGVPTGNAAGRRSTQAPRHASWSRTGRGTGHREPHAARTPKTAGSTPETPSPATVDASDCGPRPPSDATAPPAATTPVPRATARQQEGITITP